jgi:hypothetical protein
MVDPRKSFGGQIGGCGRNSTATISLADIPDHYRGISGNKEGFICSSSCDDFFLIFFSSYASQFYDAFSFYHKA